MKILLTNLSTLLLCILAFLTYTYQVDGSGLNPIITGPIGLLLWTNTLWYILKG